MLYTLQPVSAERRASSPCITAPARKDATKSYWKICQTSSTCRQPEVDYKNPENHMDNEHLSIGFVTRQTMNKLLKEGDISSQQHTKFFDAAKACHLA